MRESGAIAARESISDAKEFPPAGRAAILLAAVLTSIDSFIVNVSLPSIQSSLGGRRRRVAVRHQRILDRLRPASGLQRTFWGWIRAQASSRIRHTGIHCGVAVLRSGRLDGNTDCCQGVSRGFRRLAAPSSHVHYSSRSERARQDASAQLLRRYWWPVRGSGSIAGRGHCMGRPGRPGVAAHIPDQSSSGGRGGPGDQGLGSGDEGG